MQRSAMRELAFKLIYGIEMQKNNIDEEYLDIFIENNEIEDSHTIIYLKNITQGVKEKNEEICDLISKNLKDNWSIERVSKINLSLLKISIYEMIYTETPYKVAINEIVELAKKYSDETGPVFINGILASIVKEKELDKKEN